MCLLWLWVEAEQPQQSLTIETYPKVPITASSCTSRSRLLDRLCHCCSNPAISAEFPWQWDEGEQEWLGVGCRWQAGITALTVYMDGLCIFLLIVEELQNCACKVLIGWSEIHHDNNVRELGVRSAYAREMYWKYVTQNRLMVPQHRTCCQFTAHCIFMQTIIAQLK